MLAVTFGCVETRHPIPPTAPSANLQDALPCGTLHFELSDVVVLDEAGWVATLTVTNASDQDVLLPILYPRSDRPHIWFGAATIEAFRDGEWHHVIRYHDGTAPLESLAAGASALLEVHLPFEVGNEPDFFRLRIRNQYSPAFTFPIHTGVTTMPGHSPN